MRRFFQILLLLLFLAFGSSQNPAATPGSRLLQEARVLFDSAHYEFALERGQQALSMLPENDLEAAACLELIGDAFLESGQFPAAEQQYNAALHIFTKKLGPKHLSVAEVLNRLGEYFYRKSEYKKAVGYFQKALHIREEALGPLHELVADGFNNLGNCQVGEGHYAEAMALHQKALAIRQQTLPADHPDMATSYNNLGNCAFLSADYTGAKTSFEKALAIREKVFGIHHPKTAQTLNNLGNACAKLGLTTEAVSHYQRALEIRRRILGARHSAVASTLENLADLYFERGDYISALDLYRQAQAIQREVQGAESPAVAALWHNIALCYQYEGDYDQALSQHLAAEAILRTAYGTEHPLLAGLYNNLGNCYSGKKEFEQARICYEKALSGFESAKPVQKASIAAVYNNLGNSCLDLNKPAPALEYFRKALKTLPGGNATVAEQADYLKNQGLALERLQRRPEATAVFEVAMRLAKSAEPAILNSVQDAWGTLLCQRGIRYGDSVSLRQSIGVLEQSRRRSDSLQSSLSDPASRQRWIELQFPALTSAMEATYALWKISGENDLLEQAFALAERNKSLQLLEQLRHEQAEAGAGIPDSFVAQESDLKDLLNRREKELLALQQKGQETEAAGIAVAEARQSLAALRQQFERQYPDYFRLRYNVQTISIKTIQTQLLEEHQALLEYFVTDSAIFAFVIDAKSVHWQRLTRSSSLDEQVSMLRHSLQVYPQTAGNMTDSMARVYTDQAYQLFEAVFAPIEKNISLPEKLIVIPDGTLAYLPFECLLRERPTDAGRFKSHPYLMRDYCFSYACSAEQQWMLLQRAPSKLRQDLLAMAPVYEQNRFGLGALQHNRQEAEAVQKIFDGKVLLDTAATLDNFEQEAGKYRMLLLSMHGKASSRVGDLSYIAFSTSPDSAQNPFLYARDLYAKSIPADLVVLSACETSVGAFRFGQGVISLAKGFFQAGARSVAATLWSVDDARNAELIKLFFQHIKNGELKDEALRKAKMEYLEQHPHDESNPVYWAAVTIYGDMRPVELAGHSGTWWLLGIAITALLSFFMLWKRSHLK